jgi:hypothetical protein
MPGRAGVAAGVVAGDTLAGAAGGLPFELRSPHRGCFPDRGNRQQGLQREGGHNAAFAPAHNQACRNAW